MGNCKARCKEDPRLTLTAITPNNMYILDPMKMLENTVADEKSVLICPQEQAAKIRMEEAAKISIEEERQKWVSVFVFIPISVVV